MAKDLFKLWAQDNNEIGMSNQPFENVVVNKPTLIFFSGFLSLHTEVKSTSSRLKILDEILSNTEHNLKGGDYQVYTGSYKNFTTFFNACAYNFSPKMGFASSTAHQFVKDIILPIVTDPEGAPLPKEEAAEKLRLLTFGGYSIGTVVVQEIYNASKKALIKSGYSKQDTQDLLKEVVFLSMGTMSVPSREKNRFTTIYLVANNDRPATNKNAFFEPLQAFVTVLRKYFQKCALRISQLGENAVIATGKANRKFKQKFIDKDGQEKERPIKKLYPKWYPFDSGHELPHYLSDDDVQTVFSRIARNVIVNSHARTASLSVDDLLLPKAREGHPLTEEQERYATRIKHARRCKNGKNCQNK